MRMGALRSVCCLPVYRLSISNSLSVLLEITSSTGWLTSFKATLCLPQLLLSPALQFRLFHGPLSFPELIIRVSLVCYLSLPNSSSELQALLHHNQCIPYCSVSLSQLMEPLSTKQLHSEVPGLRIHSPQCFCRLSLCAFYSKSHPRLGHHYLL